jgi:hypothetical protein
MQMTVDTQEMMVFELTEAIIPFIESQGYSKWNKSSFLKQGLQPPCFFAAYIP